jgi:hypothetical protein
MCQIIAFRKRRESGVEEQCSDEDRARLSLCTATLSTTIASLEKIFEALSADIALLPANQKNLYLEAIRTKILMEIYTARRLLADI